MKFEINGKEKHIYLIFIFRLVVLLSSNKLEINFISIENKFHFRPAKGKRLRKMFPFPIFNSPDANLSNKITAVDNGSKVGWKRGSGK